MGRANWLAGALVIAVAAACAQTAWGADTTPLFTAVKKGDVAAVEALLKKDPRLVGVADSAGNTPLHVAVRAGKPSIAKVLLDHKADVNARTKRGVTPAHYAAAAGSRELLELLQKRGADLRAAERGGRSALHYAAGSGNRDLVTYLLDQKLNVNRLDRYGMTPLGVAATAGHIELVKFLVARKADVNKRNRNTGGLVHRMVGSKHRNARKILTFLVGAGLDLNAEGYAGQTALDALVRANNREMAAFLIKAGADVNTGAGQYFNGPLHDSPNKAMTELLLAGGARVGYRDFRGRSALHHARNTEIAGVLLKHGLRIDVRGFGGETPLHSLAAGDGRLALLKFLIGRGAGVNTPDNRGQRPLHYTASGRQPAMKAAGILLAHKADVNAADRSGRTALHAAASRNFAALVASLLKQGASPAAADGRGRSALYVAAHYGHAGAVKVLLGAKADPNAADKAGWTPLHRAVVGGHLAAAEALIAGGANVNAANRYGETALFWAKGLARTKLTDMLARRGAKAVIVPRRPAKTAPSAKAAGPRAKLAAFIVSKLKLGQGLALDVGCGDGALAVALAQRSALFIRCIEEDEAVVRKARKTIDAAGLYGTRVSAEAGSLAKLPYPSQCANLVICGDEFVRGKRARDLKELYRVLSPNGVALIGQRAGARGKKLTRATLEAWLKEAEITTFEIIEQGGVWARVTRPRPPGSDEWRYRYHDPGNAYGSNDRVVGDPMCLKWFSGWHPGTSSAGTLVGDGRIILVGLGYDDQRLSGTPTPFLQAIDAYTGAQLWIRHGQDQLPYRRSPRDYGQVQTTSDIALVGNSLYVLGGKACFEFDARDGTTRNVFPIPKEAQADKSDIWVYLSSVGDLLYGSAGMSIRLGSDWCTKYPRGNSESVFAIDRKTGALRWVHRADMMTSSLAIGGGKLYYADLDYAIHALDANTGRELWVRKDAGFTREMAVVKGMYYDNKYWVLYHPTSGRWVDVLKSGDRKRRGGFFSDPMRNSRKLAAFDSKDGRRLFDAAFPGPVSDVTFAGGSVFCGAQHHEGQLSAVDTQTGSLKWKAGKRGQNCSPTVSTPNVLLMRSGSPVMLDFREYEKSRRPGTLRGISLATVRPTCSLPALPANGMLYIPGPGCHCPTPLRASLGLAPGRPSSPDKKSGPMKGPGFGKVAAGGKRSVAWATWRADLRRSARARGAAAAPLQKSPALRWTRALPGRLTPMSVADGLVFVGSSDHRLYAVDAATGRERWRYFSAGAIRVAPFYDGGRVYIGDDGGWVHCVRAADGALVWRFRAAPAADRIIGSGRFVSRWLVGAGVIVHDGVAYFAAGYEPRDRTTVYGVAAGTGEVQWSRAYRFSPNGPMALANGALYVPTGVRMPAVIDLRTRRPIPVRLGGRGFIKAQRIAVFGERLDILCATARLTYVYHLGSYTGAAPNSESGGGYTLPIVTDDTVYLADGFHVTADRRGAGRFRLGQFFPNRRARVWRSWWQARMTAIIEAGGTLFSGDRDRVYATRATDGRELWSARAPGAVTDLAFWGGRLFVVSETGAVLCFAP